MEDIQGIAIIKSKEIDIFCKKIEDQINALTSLKNDLQNLKQVEQNKKSFVKETRVNFIIKSIEIIVGSIAPHKEKFIMHLKQAVKKAKLTERDLLNGQDI